MKVKVNYLFLGIFVLVLGGGVIYGVYWFSRGTNADTNYDTYQVYFAESVAGLAENSPVKYNGVRVGFVDKIEISKVNFREIILTMKVGADTPVTEETYATIMPQGITGLAYVGLKTIIPYGNKIKAKENQPYPVIKSSPSLFVEIDQAINQVTVNMKSLADKVDSLLDEENQMFFKNTLRHLNGISRNLNEKSGKIDESFQKANVFFEEFTKVATKLPQMLEKIENALSVIEDTAGSVNKSSKAFNATMQNTGKLMSDVSSDLLPTLGKTIEQLEHTLNSVDVVSRELQENPSMLIRGKYPAKLGPGEKR